MEIGNIIQAAYKTGPERRTSPGKPVKKGGKSTSFPIRDKVEISGKARDKKLSIIKDRIKSGFYSSSKVTDDLSEKLSNVLDDMFK